MMLKLSPYFASQDERGGFVGITQEHWAEINFIETKAQQVRGGHYHKETRELFFVISGEIDVVIEDLQSGKQLEMSVGKGDVFVIEPYELHTFYVRTNAEWINMLSRPLDQENPDFHRVAEEE